MTSREAEIGAAVELAVLSLKRKKESADEKEARDREARESLLAYAFRTFPRYKAPRHVRVLVDALEWVERTEDARLIVVMPPRHSKSVNVSEIFPAWFMERDPDRKVIGASHSAPLAYRFSRRVRERVSSPLSPFGGIRLSTASSAVRLWEVAGREGSYAAVGVGGSPAGLGGDLISIDDPIPNQAAADSSTYRENVWEWYRNTMRDRLAPGGRIILTATRWHEDDLTGRLLKAMEDGTGEKWRVLHFPAEATEHDELGRAPGDPLWAEVWSKARLEALKLAVGSRGWQARFQGSPSSPGGNLLRVGWMPRYDRIPATATEVLQSWDTAYKTSEGHDYSVCITAAVSPTDAYLVDVWREKLELPDLQRAFRSRSLAWRPYESLVEDRGSGTSLIQWGRRQKGLPPIIAMPAVKSKETRANDVAPYFEAGRIHLPTSASWLEDFLEEVKAFPHGANDDQVDAATQIAARLWLLKEAGEARSTDYTRYMEADAEDEEEELYGLYG